MNNNFRLQKNDTNILQSRLKEARENNGNHQSYDKDKSTAEIREFLSKDEASAEMQAFLDKLQDICGDLVSEYNALLKEGKGDKLPEFCFLQDIMCDMEHFAILSKEQALSGKHYEFIKTNEEIADCEFFIGTNSDLGGRNNPIIKRYENRIADLKDKFDRLFEELYGMSDNDKDIDLDR